MAEQKDVQEVIARLLASAADLKVVDLSNFSITSAQYTQLIKILKENEDLLTIKLDNFRIDNKLFNDEHLQSLLKRVVVDHPQPIEVHCGDITDIIEMKKNLGDSLIIHKATAKLWHKFQEEKQTDNIAATGWSELAQLQQQNQQLKKINLKLVNRIPKVNLYKTLKDSLIKEITHLEVVDKDRLVSASHDGHLHFWDINTEQLIQTVAHGHQGISLLKVLPNRQIISSGLNDAKIWQEKTKNNWTCVQSINNEAIFNLLWMSHTNQILTISGLYAGPASGKLPNNGKFMVWDMNSTATGWTWKRTVLGQDYYFCTMVDGLEKLNLLPDDKVALNSIRGVEIWESKLGQWQQVNIIPNKGFFSAVTLSSNKVLASSENGSVEIWELDVSGQWRAGETFISSTNSYSKPYRYCHMYYPLLALGNNQAIISDAATEYIDTKEGPDLYTHGYNLKVWDVTNHASSSNLAGYSTNDYDLALGKSVKAALLSISADMFCTLTLEVEEAEKHEFEMDEHHSVSSAEEDCTLVQTIWTTKPRLKRIVTFYLDVMSNTEPLDYPRVMIDSNKLAIGDPRGNIFIYDLFNSELEKEIQQASLLDDGSKEEKIEIQPAKASTTMAPHSTLFKLTKASAQVEILHLDAFKDSTGAPRKLTRADFLLLQSENPTAIFLLPDNYPDSALPPDQLHTRAYNGGLAAPMGPKEIPGTKLYDLSVIGIPTLSWDPAHPLTEQDIKHAFARVYKQLSLGRKIIIPYSKYNGKERPAFGTGNGKGKIDAGLTKFLTQQFEDLRQFVAGKILLTKLDQHYQQAWMQADPIKDLWPVGQGLEVVTTASSTATPML